VRVLDLSQNLAGPFATQILADFGADVIKVEPPGGDPARAWGPPFQAGESPLFLCANRSKRSLVLDLNLDEDRDALSRLAARADVFVQAFRSGVAQRLGFGYEAVRELNPAVIYVSVTAFGTDGPLRDDPGYDPLMQAYAGLMSVTGHAGGPPARVGTSLVDMGTGMWTALAIMAALHRESTMGRGPTSPRPSWTRPSPGWPTTSRATSAAETCPGPWGRAWA
jgi:crotonobetainyl-CoA:carnitine CoA-transferase CaiB-like acyl-CoA transferase